jgi:hypothetical protein
MCLGAALIAIAVLGWSIYDTGGDNYSSIETPLVSFDAQLDNFSVLGLFHPNNAVAGQGMMFARHRYPAVSGGNISTVIHQGYDALRKQPNDPGWFNCPPSESAW